MAPHPAPLATLRSRCHVTDLAFAHRSDMLAVAGTRTRRLVESFVNLTIWKIGQNEISGPAMSVEIPGWQARTGFSADDSYVVVAGNDLRIFESSSGSNVSVINSDNTGVADWAFSPDCEWLAVCFEDGGLQLLNIRKWTAQKRIATGSKRMYVNFLKDSKQLIVVTHEGKEVVIQKFLIPHLRLIGVIRTGHSKDVDTVVYCGESDILSIIMGGERILRIELGTGAIQLHRIVTPDRIWAISISPDSHSVISSTLEIIRKQRPTRIRIRGLLSVCSIDHDSTKSFLAHNDSITAISSSQRGKLLATATKTQVKIWDYNVFI